MSEDGGVEHRRPDGEYGRYSYRIHSSGALIIWITKDDEEATVDVVYGPGAWIKVSGQQKGQEVPPPHIA
jgi:hypothetical protein